MPSTYLRNKAAADKGAQETRDVKALAAMLAEIKRELKKITDIGGDGYKGFEDSCKYVGCSRDTLYRKVKANELTMYRLGAKPLFKVSDLNQLPKPVARGEV